MNFNIIPQFEIGLNIVTRFATRSQYYVPSANRQVHAVCTADSFSFASLVKKNVGGETKLANNHLLATSCRWSIMKSTNIFN